MRDLGVKARLCVLVEHPSVDGVVLGSGARHFGRRGFALYECDGVDRLLEARHFGGLGFGSSARLFRRHEMA